MTVTTTITLPEQPANGQVFVQDLKGSGYASPKFVYNVIVVSTGDASGGSHRINVEMDPMHTSMCMWMASYCEPGGADRLQRYGIWPTPSNDLVQITANVTTGGAAGGYTPSAYWVPPPILMTRPDDQAANSLPKIQVISSNVSGADLGFKAQILVFERDVSLRVPYEQIVASMRGVGYGGP